MTSEKNGLERKHTSTRRLNRNYSPPQTIMQNMTKQNNRQIEHNQVFILSEASTAGPSRFRSFWSSSAAGNGSTLLWCSQYTATAFYVTRPPIQPSIYYILTTLRVSLAVTKRSFSVRSWRLCWGKVPHDCFAKTPQNCPLYSENHCSTDPITLRCKRSLALQGILLVPTSLYTYL